MALAKWFAAIAISWGVTLAASKVLPSFDAQQIQAVASTMATVTGILFGFVLACVTLLASASGNTLVRNTQMTGYLPRLMRRMHQSMGALLVVCVLFLVSLFLPLNLPADGIFPWHGFRAVDLVVLAGVFFFTLSVSLFASVWRRFAAFAANM